MKTRGIEVGGRPPDWDVTRPATLIEDATVYNDSVQLRYRRRGYRELFSGPPKEICPPVESLKKGTKIMIKYVKGRVAKVELRK